MKRFSTFFLALGLLGGADNLWAQSAGQSAVSATCAIIKQDANSRVWERTTCEQCGNNGPIITNKHSFIELATGLNYTNNLGQWTASKEEIDILSDGTAAATNGQHQAYFPSDIYAGEIKLVTPDGVELHSRPVGLSYDDGSNSVLIAELTNSIGYLVGSNQVIYPNAFIGFAADLRYTYTKAGFEQDVILREQPPSPASLNLNPDTTKIQVLTEFFNPPAPQITTSTNQDEQGLTDQQLGFGEMQMMQGRAFLLGTNSSTIQVDKQWLQLEGRQFLVEEVPTASMADELESLPLPTTQANASISSNGIVKRFVLPPQHFAKVMQGKKAFMVAKSALPIKGLVLDYLAINAGKILTNYIFQADLTYFISGPVIFIGGVTFQGGAVIKYPNDTTASIQISGSALSCQTSPYRPVVFTSGDDDSVGESMRNRIAWDGYTGTVSGGYANPALILNNNGTLQNVRICYAQQAITASVGITLRDSQIINCVHGVAIGGSGRSTAILDNCLIACTGLSPDDYTQRGYSSGDLLSGSGNFILNSSTLDDENTDYHPIRMSTNVTNIFSTNSIFVNVTDFGCTNLFGENNGFWNTPSTFGDAPVSAGSSPFNGPTPVSGGQYYLNGSSAFINQGASDLDPLVSADIAQKTTQPPTFLGSFTSGTNFGPTVAVGDHNLGYHYDRLDYILWQDLTRTNLNFLAGTAVGWLGQGLSVSNGVSVVFNGTAQNPCYFVRCNTLQERDLQGDGIGIINSTNTSPSPAVTAAFTKFSAIGTAATFVSANSLNFNATNCEFWDGYLGTNNIVGTASWNFMNCLFDRTVTFLWSDLSLPVGNLFLENCTFHGGTLNLGPTRRAYPVLPIAMKNSAIDGTSLSFNGYGVTNAMCSKNAYLTGAAHFPNDTNDITVTNFNWQTSWFGNYYQATNSLLVDKGSTTADQLGLYHFTTQTNQLLETNSIVDIGYHYVATDANGIPLDSNGDGISDYLEDSNGDGLVDNGETNWEIAIITQPLSQEVVDGDTVTFTAYASGVGLTYQWTLNGTNIYGATGSSYTINAVDYSQAGNYVCIITGAVGSTTSQTATLTVDGGGGNPNQTEVVGQRQDYTFRSGITYYVGSTIQLYGNTTFEAGTIVKFDYNGLYPGLQVFGSVTCKGVAYNPSVLTTIDDDAFGVQWSGGNIPQTYFTGVPDLDLSQADSLSLTNVWFRYADAAVVTPEGGQLDIWDGQFFQCNASILNEFGGVDSLHNVLFAGCQEAIAADTNSFAVTAENVTADVANLCMGSNAPTYIRLTNSIVTGDANGASLQNSVISPNPSNFQTNGTANYYLATGSTLHQSGTANISTYLLNEFQSKTTYAPLALPEFMSLSGNLTLSPQVPRYTNGAPDIGYYYAALDYTVAGMTNFGTITVLPGTAIGLREDLNSYTFEGFDLREESSFVSHGTPAKPVVFTDVVWVQEQYAFPCYASFVPDFEGLTNDAAPAMDFRFCNFYPAVGWYNVWAGQDIAADYMASYNSVVNWTMRDCNVHGGEINLGEPDNGNFHGIPYTTYYGAGEVTWNNNLFENVQISLQPTFIWYDGTINMDLAFQVYNNLFQNSSSIVLVPSPSSAGNWTFEDNLFDQVNLYQYPGLPLDYDYNGYWPLTPLQLQYGFSSQLQPTTTSDGFTDGGNEQVLSYAPPYVTGAFGNYYLSTLTGLYEAGSRTAGAAGLAQYTTFISQTKDISGSAVDIGLHYVAATNNAPLDTDGDGIPDYVEDANGNGVMDAGETDPINSTTDGMTNDIYNAAYLNIDLSGDGLVGRVKAALGMNPLAPSNPLMLTQVIDGQEPDIATFELPIRYNTLTNIGVLNLYFNGVDVTLKDFTNASDGNSLLKWNTTYEPPGQHYLQAQLTLRGPSYNLEIIAGVGTITPFYTSNVIQFFQGDSMFNSSIAYLDAQLKKSVADYAIQLYDPSTTPPTLINTITGSTSSGLIQTNWNLTYSDDVTLFTNNTVNAVFIVTQLDSGSSTNTKILKQATTSEQGNGFDFAYAYTPTNEVMRNQYNNDNGNDDGIVWVGMQAVVDKLLMPDSTGNESLAQNYDSGFNNYTGEGNNIHGNGLSEGFPGYLGSMADVTNQSNGLFLDMNNKLTKNFYCHSHGSGNWIGSWDLSVSINASDIADLLKNHGLWPQNPYRFVFLDSCSTASARNWQQAFGIFPMENSYLAGLNNVGPQAYVGWATDITGWMNGIQGNPTGSDDLAQANANMLLEFYSLWMNGATVKQCIDSASTPAPNICPLPVPQNSITEFTINGRTYKYGNVLTSKIFVVGHSGLTRSTLITNLDNNYAEPASLK